MSEENNNMSAQQAALQRNVSNNANNVRAAADIAANTSNPYAKAAGTAVKVADKLSDGKASEKLGKATDKFLKSQGLKGKMMQAALNKMSESGTSDRLASAMNKKNGSPSGKNTPGGGTPSAAKASDAGTQNKIKDSSEEKSSNEGFGSVGGSTNKIVKYGLIGCALLFPLIIFAILFTGSSQVFVNSISLGTVDSLSSEEAEEKINKKGEEGLDEEKTDDDVAYDIYINDGYSIRFRKDTLTDNNIIQIANGTKYLRRKYNEASLDKIEEFYPAVKDESKNYDENMVYDFFYKMYNLYISYRDNYDVYLDLPLLMSTLNLQSKDKNVIFSSNLSAEDRTTTARELPIAEFDYYYDWSNSDYISNKKASNHDMEILARNMVSKQVKETCVDSSGKNTQENILRDNEIGTQTLTCGENETYKTEELGYVVDNQKYKEFLKEFLEKKYYTKDGFKANEMVHNVLSGNSNNNSCSIENPFKKYELTDEQLILLTSRAMAEQGTPKGAAAEASLMANLFELKGKKYGTDGNGLYNYVVYGGWFGSSEKVLKTNRKLATEEAIQAVRSVLVDGKRTLPAYVNEHDCINCTKSGGDISNIKLDGKSVSKTDKSNYVQHKTIIKNVYGATYTFYSFPTETSDPFGYTSEKIREEKGEFYYDYETGQLQNCESNSSENISSTSSTNLSSAFVSLALSQLNDPSKKGGKKYWQFMGFKSYQPWCAAFVSWNIYNTEYNGQKLSDVIKYKNAAVYNFMNYFYNSKDENIKFYYNDSCKLYKNKNGTNTTYIPKQGDLIFFDNYKNWDGKMPKKFQSGRNHIGIVQYVKDGKIVTIEGNSGDAVKERKYNLNSCHVVGFGSWY